jgi:hypothetical protein
VADGGAVAVSDSGLAPVVTVMPHDRVRVEALGGDSLPTTVEELRRVTARRGGGGITSTLGGRQVMQRSGLPRK